MAFTNEETARAMAAIQAASEKSGQSVADLLRTYESIRQTMESSGGQGGDIAAHNANANAHAALFGVKIRRRLAADTNYYVQKDGNDSNDGLSASTAFLTMNRMIEELRRIDGCGFGVSINLGAGNWGAVRFYQNILIGTMFLNIIGAGKGVTVLGDAQYGLDLRGPYQFEVSNLTIQNCSFGMHISHGAVVYVRAIELITSGNGLQITHKGVLGLQGDIAVSGQYTCLANVISNGELDTASGSITFVDNPDFSYGVFVVRNGYVSLYNQTVITGNATGRKYVMSGGAILQTWGRGETILPGTVAGDKDASCAIV